MTEGYSQQAIRESNARFDDRGWGISFSYGVLTPYCPDPEDTMQRIRGEILSPLIRVGDEKLTEEALDERLKALNERTGRTYIQGNSIPGETFGKWDHFTSIGLTVDSLMHHEDQHRDGFVPGEALETLLGQADQIVADLQSVGFTGITKDDLYLHAEAYDH